MFVSFAPDRLAPTVDQQRADPNQHHIVGRQCESVVQANVPALELLLSGLRGRGYSRVVLGFICRGGGDGRLRHWRRAGGGLLRRSRRVFGVALEGLDIGELIAKRVVELRCGEVVVAGLAARGSQCSGDCGGRSELPPSSRASWPPAPNSTASSNLPPRSPSAWTRSVRYHHRRNRMKPTSYPSVIQYHSMCPKDITN